MKKIILFMFTAFFAWPVSAQVKQVKQMMDKKQENIVVIAALTGKGDLDKLKAALVESLDAGMTINEIKEVLVHSYAYCGFPRALRGLQTFVAVLEERKSKGIEDKIGREASSISDTRSKYERGRDILAEISGVPTDAPKANYAVLAPEIERFLKEHLFADLFERDVLTYAEREIATVSILATIGGVEPMMMGHMNIALHVGVTPSQLHHLLVLVEKNIGRSEADAGRIVLNSILQNKGVLTDSGKTVTEAGDSIKVQKVTFHNRFLIDVIGDLYFPADYDSSKKYGAIIVSHPFGGVRDSSRQPATAGIHTQVTKYRHKHERIISCNRMV